MRFIACALFVFLLLPPTQGDARPPRHRVTHTAHAKPHRKPAATPAAASGNSRHSALVMDADTGEILYQDRMNEERYPASLTKMMTLYMMFDALRSGRLHLSDRMTASAKASGMPKTNVSLRPGDTITVEQAIKSLVVVSANDAAVVCAEKLGGSEWNFGVMMSNKATQLGMKDTIYRNANGLPDTRQHTTAYDQAVLGRALRRDFPQYYHYFSIRAFDMNGRTYVGHNHVLDRLQGVDGIKTGFINASGFNLVSSLKQNGVSLVAVVMGGSSWPSRDNEMVGLLQKNYTVLAERHHSPHVYAQAAEPQPVVVAKDVSPAAPAIAPTVAVAQVDAKKLDEAIAMAPTATPSIPGTMFAVSMTPPVAPHAALALTPANTAASSSKLPAFVATLEKATAVKPVAGNTLDYQFAMLSTPTATDAPSIPADTGKGWGIQVGAFRSQKQARDAVSSALGSIAELKNAYMNITSEGSDSAPIHRARLGNLTHEQADAACHKLNAVSAACFPLRMN